MKKISFQHIINFTILGFMMVLFTNCNENLLDQDNPNKITPGSFWKTQEDATANLTAVYSMFRDQYYNRFIPMGWRGDDVEGTTSNTNYSQFNTFALTDANSTCSTAWNQHFKGIYYANQFLHYITDIKMDEALKARYIGEAKFLRAYYYFNLIVEFKNIPLITDVITSSADYNQPQVPPEKVFAQIEQDLTDAANVLPNTYPAADLGRITKGAAYGFLGKCLLFQQKWQQASDVLKNVIDSKTYDLLPSYSDVFLEANDFNKECLLEVPFVLATVNGKDLSQTDNKREAMGKAGGWYMYWPTEWLFNEMKKEKTTDGDYDPRLYQTIIFPNSTRTYYGKSYASMFGASTNLLGFGKYSEWERSSKITTNSGKNQKLLRYSDVLLMYAECLVKLERPTDAVVYVNKVRNRAKLASLPTNISATDLLLDIEHQRVIELACEMNRYFDLLRWNGNILGTKTIKEVLQDHNDAGALNFVPGKSEYLPIPLAELQTNPLIIQNPGY
ncbi:MAG: RagB/SusD family nutrient uptake outer membrane protein [Proteiniphilum sp.]